MIDLQITEQELNTLLQGLYLLEDQYWVKSKVVAKTLIKKLNELLPPDE